MQPVSYTHLTHDHFWDPLDKKYIDFDTPFDMENEAMVPESQVMAFRIPYVSEFLKDPKERIRFINHMQLWSFSSILHGEQGALNLSLIHISSYNRSTTLIFLTIS